MNNEDDIILKELIQKREAALRGELNCIPFPFSSLRAYLPGIEQAKYICVTANQKVGKTKFCDFTFVYETLFYTIAHPEVKAKILYFCLEESAKKKRLDFYCHLLYRLDGITISSTELSSIGKPVPENILNLLQSEKYMKYIQAFQEMVTFYDNIKHPTGIYKTCEEYALSQGHYNYETYITKDPLGNPIQKQKRNPITPYTSNNPSIYNIVIVDNASNLSYEANMSKMQTIERFSKYAVELRNIFKFTIILIQHQAQAQEGIINTQAKRNKPTSDGLGDCKLVSRDISLLLGLYNPFKYNDNHYMGYDIKRLGNNTRFLEVLEDRNYGANGAIIGLFFNGASSYFKELPNPENAEQLQKIYSEVDKLKQKPSLILT